MVEAAQDALQSLVCIENSRHNKLCFFLPSAWPEPLDSSWVDCNVWENCVNDAIINDDALSVSISNGIYAFWFNEDDKLQAAE